MRGNGNSDKGVNLRGSREAFEHVRMSRLKENVRRVTIPGHVLNPGRPYCVTIRVFKDRKIFGECIFLKYLHTHSMFKYSYLWKPKQQECQVRARLFCLTQYSVWFQHSRANLMKQSDIRRYQ